MHKRIAVAVILFWPLLAAADWQSVADTSLGQLRLDEGSVSSDGKYTKAVLVYRFKQQQRFSAPPKDVFDSRQDDVLIDCSGQDLGIQSSRFFDKERLVTTTTLAMKDIKFKHSAPNTMVETVVKAVCALTPNKQR